MHLNKRFFAKLSITAILIALFSFFWSGNTMAASSGDPVPAFSLSTLDGGHLTNRSMVGHVSLLNVWASWCSYCREEHGMLMRIKNQYHIPIYGIAYRDNPSNARAFLAEEGNPYVAVGVDWDGNSTDALDVTGTPVTFLIDKHGVIRYRHTGSIDSSSWNNDFLPRIKEYQAES